MTSFHRNAFRPGDLRSFASLTNQLLREMSRTGPGSAGRATQAAATTPYGVFPPVNLEESEDRYVLTAELPGVDPENIDVSIEGATVTLSGERKVLYAAGNGVAVHRRERQSGTFRRAFDLPAEVDVEAAKATHKHGVLTLDLPKTAAVKPRQIEVETR